MPDFLTLAQAYVRKPWRYKQPFQMQDTMLKRKLFLTSVGALTFSIDATAIKLAHSKEETISRIPSLFRREKIFFGVGSFQPQTAPAGVSKIKQKEVR